MPFMGNVATIDLAPDSLLTRIGGITSTAELRVLLLLLLLNSEQPGRAATMGFLLEHGLSYQDALEGIRLGVLDGLVQLAPAYLGLHGYQLTQVIRKRA